LDARLNDYEFYSCLDYNVYLALNGDCLDRYFLRFNEMVESCRIIYSLLLFLFSSSFLFSLWSLCDFNSAVSDSVASLRATARASASLMPEFSALRALRELR